MTTDFSHITARNRSLICWSLVSGIMLIPLLALGSTAGVGSFAFSFVFALHLGAASVTVAIALSIIRSLFATPRAQWGCWILFALALLSLGALGALPPTSRDALIHHLAVPKWWSEAGRIVEIPWHEWSYYPMLLNLAYTGFLEWRLPSLCAPYHAIYLLLLSTCIGAFLWERTHERFAGILGFFFALLLPININLASSPLVDLGLAYYTFAALVLIIWWAEGREGGISRSTAYAGIALGLALSIKYNGLLAAFAVVLLTLPFAQRSGRSFMVVASALFTLSCAALVIYSPWLIRNEVLVGNPLYPLFGNIFGGATLGSSGGGGLSTLSQRLLLYQETPFEIALTPLRMLFSGADGDPRRFDGVLSPFLILSVLALITGWNRPWVRFLGGVLITYLVLQLFTSAPRIRYLAPVYGIALSLSIVAVTDCTARNARLRRAAIVVIVAVQLLLSLFYTAELMTTRRLVSYYRGETETRYLTTMLSDYSAIQFSNALPPTSKIYLLFTANRFYYFDRATLSSGHYSGNALRPLLGNESGETTLTAFFDQQMVTHIMANSRLFNQWLSALPEEAQQRWLNYSARYLVPVFTEGDYIVWSRQRDETPR